jgi:hypothetical protein
MSLSAQVSFWKERSALELNWKQYQPGREATVITTIDAHAAGAPLRIITGGVPELSGAHCLSIVTPEADLGVLFKHNEGYSTKFPLFSTLAISSLMCLNMEG